MIRCLKMIVALGPLLASVVMARESHGVSIQSVATYKSSVTSDSGGFLDLKAELNYESTRTKAPIVVVMHGYSGDVGKATEVRDNAQRLRDAGCFAISVAMRGRDRSDGIRDSGGVEVYDIYDAVEHVKTNYAKFVDATNVHITGYSGGGANVMSAVTRFPDYFRAGSSYFGVSDYGYDTTNSFYFKGAQANHRNQLHADVGNPTLGDPNVQDRYQARASNLAAHNNPYSEIHLFVNRNETACPPFHHALYRDNAVAAAARPGEFSNIHVHLGGAGKYQDFNGNQVNDADEAQNWPHGYPNANEQHAAESWYLPRILNGSIPEPVLKSDGRLVVPGFVKTKKFSLWLGDGQNAVGDFTYEMQDNDWTFAIKLLSNNKHVTGTLKVETASFAGRPLTARLNGQVVSRFVGGKPFEQSEIGHNDVFTLTVVSQSDRDSDGK